MNTKRIPEGPGLCDGIAELIDPILHAATDERAVAEIPSSLASTIESMWRMIAANWIDGRCQWRGNNNWRWKLCPNLAEKNTSAEVKLNRTLARKLAETNPDQWANEIPTGSGL